MRRRRYDFLESWHKFMMKSHCKFKFLETIFNFLLYMFILNGNNFKHFFHMKNKILKVTIFFDDFINRKRNSRYPLSSHIESNLIFLWYKICNLKKITYFLRFMVKKFILYFKYAILCLNFHDILDNIVMLNVWYQS